MKRMKMLMLLMAAIMGSAILAWATALTAEKDTPERLGRETSLTMASNVIIYAGSMVCVDSSGLANPAADSSGFAVVGRAQSTVDNRTAVYVSTKTINIAMGVFRWENADTILDSDIGKIAYVTDDQTVNKTGGGQNIIAGTVIDVDDDGVWVDTARVGPIGAATPSSLAVSGAATVGTTLAVTGNTDFGGTVDITNNVTVGAQKVVITAASGNTAIAGTLAVTGAANLIGGIVGGYTGTLTNNLVGYTNLTYFNHGMVSNVVYTGAP